MNDDSQSPTISTVYTQCPNSSGYIPTSPTSRRPEKVDRLLEKRMLEFMLSRRQKRWIEKGE
jgi:hypothetical protein